MDKVYDEFVTVAIQVRTVSSDEEAKGISTLIAAEDNNVFSRKKLVSQLF